MTELTRTETAVLSVIAEYDGDIHISALQTKVRAKIGLSPESAWPTRFGLDLVLDDLKHYGMLTPDHQLTVTGRAAARPEQITTART